MSELWGGRYEHALVMYDQSLLEDLTAHVRAGGRVRDFSPKLYGQDPDFLQCAKEDGMFYSLNVSLLELEALLGQTPPEPPDEEGE